MKLEIPGGVVLKNQLAPREIACHNGDIDSEQTICFPLPTFVKSSFIPAKRIESKQFMLSIRVLHSGLIKWIHLFLMKRLSGYKMSCEVIWLYGKRTRSEIGRLNELLNSRIVHVPSEVQEKKYELVPSMPIVSYGRQAESPKIPAQDGVITRSFATHDE